MASTFQRAGAICYLLWGVLHVVVGLYPVVLFLTAGPEAMLGSIPGMEQVPSIIEEPFTQASYMLAQHYFNLAAFGILAILVAMRMNWKGSVLGFWINLVVLGMVDVSFIAAEIVPGYMPVEMGILGPILYVLGAALTGAALVASSRPADVPEGRKAYS